MNCRPPGSMWCWEQTTCSDAFCPLGSHDPLAILSLAALAAHLTAPLAAIFR